jgi:hypothetical protein
MMCIELSRPHNIHVVYNTTREGKIETNKREPEYLVALEHVFRQSARIESPRLMNY